MDNFDLKKYLAEGRLLKEEISPQKALPIAKKVANQVEDTPEFEEVVDAISKDPKATSELLKLIGLNEGEGITEDIVDKLALQFAQKVEDNPEIIKEESGSNYGGAFWTGLVGGGALANYAASLADPIAKSMSHNPSYMVATVIGAVGGAILALLGKRLYDKIKKRKTQENQMGNFDLKKYLDEGKLLKEEMSLDIMDDDFVELMADSGDYSGEIEDDKVSFSVVYDDYDDFGGFDEDNWKGILGPNHAFVKIASKIPTEVEALDDYVMITVNLEDLKSITTTNE